jgi:predicted nuclease of predicted toxin-antitoxin system
MMRFKIDENLQDDVALAMRAQGHDVQTVREQGLRGGSDERLAAAARGETRALVTLDLHFADIRQYPPQDFPGFIVLRVANQSRPAVLRVMDRVMDCLNREPIHGHLWVASEAGIRIRAGRSTG